MSEDTKQFKCRNCGGRLTFNPESGSLGCASCGTQFEIAKTEESIDENDFHAHLEADVAASESVETRPLCCKSCGAETVFEEHITSTECPYCCSTMVVGEGSRRLIKPKSLLPFNIDEKSAKQAFDKWLSKLWFAPSGLKKLASAKKLQGIYLPFWTYDFDAATFYHGKRGDDYWETEHYTEMVDGKSVRKSRQVRKTRWHSVSGQVFDQFDDLMTSASPSLPAPMLEKLEPWDLHELVPFKSDYLSGFGCESYRIGLEEGMERAKQLAASTIDSTIERDIGGDHQRISSKKSQYGNITFKHLLLPVWLSAYKFKDKVFRFAVNARTAEVQGERPWSALKITLLIVVIAMVVGGLALAISKG